MKTFTFCAALILQGALHGQVSTVTPTSTSFELVITEIMADPDPPFGLPNAEYVEVLNRSGQPVNLTGYTFYEGSSRALPGITLLPGEYLIICANSDTLNFQPYGKVAGISSMSLTNGGEKLAIRNPQGLPVDSVTYSDMWYGDSFKKDGGWSLERIDTDFTCHNSGNWKASLSASGGTPGSINSVSGIYSDLVAPVLLRAFSQDSITVTLVFSEAIDPATVVLLQNYSFNTGFTATHAYSANATNSRVSVELNSSIIKNKIYTVEVNHITDCAGNVIASNSSARFGIADSNSIEGIVFNEVLFNPLAGGYDFVELFHTGDKIIDVRKIKIASIDLTSGEPIKVETISAEPLLFFPDDYLVLSEKPEIVAQYYRSSFPYNFIEVAKLPAMNVDAGHIALSFDGLLFEEFKYNQNFHFPLLENFKGVSLEKINPNRKSMDPTSWHSASPSMGFATPGLRNSQYAENGNITKIVSVFPEIFSPDFDGLDDVITFSIKPGNPGYIGNITIYSARGQVIYENKKNNLLSTDDTFSWNGIDKTQTISPPGIYVALVEIFNLNGDVKNYKVPFVLAVKL